MMPRDRWYVYKLREPSRWYPSWIVQPPKTDDFNNCYAFYIHRRALQFALDRAFRDV